MIAIYARQSVDKKDSISISTQIEMCKKEFNKNESYTIYKDKGFSGKDTNRPEFERMIKDVKSGIINRVIVYKLDRISRSTLDFAKIIDIFKKHNIDFVSTTEKFDTSTPIGKAMLQIIMIFAELERETIQQRITDNYYARGKRGFGLGGTTPYGFERSKIKVDGQKTSIYKENLEQSKWLVKMYEMYSDTNMSLGKVSSHLNDLGVPAPRGGRWDSNKISRILRNPIYVKADADVYLYYKNKGCIMTNELSDFVGINGCYLYGQRKANERKYTDVTDHTLSIALHKGIIDSDVWLSCQYKLDSNKQIKNSGKSKHTWLSGLTKCGYCGYAVTVVTAWKGAYKYFNCRGKTNLKICNGHTKTILVEDIEENIEKHIFKKAIELKNTNVKISSNTNKDTNGIKIEIIDIENKIENLISQIANSNEVVMGYINKTISDLDKHRNELVEEMNKINMNNRKTEPLEKVLEKIKDWSNLDLEDKKEIANSMINKILITDEEINIEWKV